MNIGTLAQASARSTNEETVNRDLGGFGARASFCKSSLATGLASAAWGGSASIAISDGPRQAAWSGHVALFANLRGFQRLIE